MTTKSSSHFSSKKSAIILASLLSASVVFVGVTLAQGLTIPTNLNNAVITIQKIFLSANGVSTDTSIPNATISLDGSNGSINNQGNLTVGGAVQLSNYPCATNTSGCILKVDANGNVSMTDNLSDFSNEGGETVFKRTSDTDPSNVFLAGNDGNASQVGQNSDQAVLRVGATTDNIPVQGSTRTISKPDTAMIVAGTVESRGGILIRKDNNNAVLGNAGNNLRANLDSNYTELDINTKAGIINMVAGYDSAGTQDASFILSNQDDTKKVTLDVRGDALIGDVANPSGDKLTVYGSTRANNYLYNSDRRYKSDIKPLTSALESLLKITGYHYFNKLENKDSLGVIAQEVEAVYPELVQTDKAGYKSVAYGNLVAPIIEAIRELSHKVDSLFDIYVSQQSRIDMLEARLQSLEAQK